MRKGNDLAKETMTNMSLATVPKKKPAFLERTSTTAMDEIRIMLLITRWIALPLDKKIKVNTPMIIGKVNA